MCIYIYIYIRKYIHIAHIVRAWPYSSHVVFLSNGSGGAALAQPAVPPSSTVEEAERSSGRKWSERTRGDQEGGSRNETMLWVAGKYEKEDDDLSH